MDVIVVRKNNKEVGRIVPSKKTLIVGRSPVCDLILRTQEMKPLHFLIEWIGEGDFKPNEGFWSLVDISKLKNKNSQNYSGEATILQKTPIQVEGFEFVIQKDDLAETALSKGVLSRSMEFESDHARTLSSGENFVVEVITYDRRNDIVTDINHFSGDILSRGLRVAHLPKLFFTLSSSQKNSLLVENQGETQLVDVFNRTERVTSNLNSIQSRLEILPGDFYSFLSSESAYYFRWVQKVEVITPPNSWKKDPVLLTLLASLFFVLCIGFLIKNYNYTPEIIPPAPVRIAKIEVPLAQIPQEKKEIELPPPAEEKQLAPEPQIVEEKQPVKEIKPEEKVPKTEEKVQAAKASGAKANPVTQADKISKTQNVGLQQPKAEISDVNTVGLLGKLKGGSSSKARVKADQLLNQARPTDTASGATGTIGVSQPNLGQVGSSSEKGPAGSKNPGPGLSAASTTLKAGKITDGSHVSGLVGGEGKERFGGQGLAGKAKDSGTGGMGLDTKSMEVTGGLTKEDIRKALKDNQRAIRNCYERALLAKKDLEGRLVMRWKISPPGPVESISIQNSNMGMPSLENCVLDIIKKIQFPQALNNQPTIVIYPFLFQGKN